MLALEDSFRPLTDVEARLLKTKVSSPARRHQRYRARIAVISLCLWAGGSALTLVADKTLPGWIIIAVWAVIASLMAAWLLLEDKSKRSSRTRAFEDALRHNQAHVNHIRSDQMVAL